MHQGGDITSIEEITKKRDNCNLKKDPGFVEGK